MCVGTKRYMPPEILDGTMNFSYFANYTKADIYSSSLTLWEIFTAIKQ